MQTRLISLDKVVSEKLRSSAKALDEGNLAKSTAV
jgi:hypothetical protein